MFLKSTFLNIDHNKRQDKNKGVTLIELLITTAIIGLISMVVASMFLIGIKSFNIAERQIESYSSGRLAYLNLERQLKSSEKIFIKEDRVYLQDLENPAKYFNYYILSGSQIKKYKVDQDTLIPIPSGSKSQFAENVIDFKLIKVPKSKNIFQLKIITEKEENKLDLNSLIRVGVDVIKK